MDTDRAYFEWLRAPVLDRARRIVRNVLFLPINAKLEGRAVLDPPREEFVKEWLENYFRLAEPNTRAAYEMLLAEAWELAFRMRWLERIGEKEPHYIQVTDAGATAATVDRANRQAKSIKQIARERGQHERTVARALRDKTLPALPAPGGKWYLVDEIEEPDRGILQPSRSLLHHPTKTNVESIP
ncbi:MAG: hypothetical protein AMXMBFR7_47630 [Planctomycetota bacterium]